MKEIIIIFYPNVSQVADKLLKRLLPTYIYLGEYCSSNINDDLRSKNHIKVSSCHI